MVPSAATTAAMRRSPITPWRAIGGAGMNGSSPPRLSESPRGSDSTTTDTLHQDLSDRSFCKVPTIRVALTAGSDAPDWNTQFLPNASRTFADDAAPMQRRKPDDQRGRICKRDAIRSLLAGEAYATPARAAPAEAA